MVDIKWALNYHENCTPISSIIRLPLCILFFILFIILFSTGNMEARIITVDDDGGGDFKSIQDAINSSENGDTILISDGIYHESVIVNRSINLEGQGNGSVRILSRFVGYAVKVTADWVNVTGLNITGEDFGNQSGTGLKVISNHTNIYRNIFSSNKWWRAIELSNAEYCAVSNNSVESDEVSGINLYRSYNTTIFNNTLRCDTGIDLEYSCFNRIFNNDCTESRTYGIVLENDSNNNTIWDNVCSAKDGYGIHVIRSHNNTIDSNDCSKCDGAGIRIYRSSYNIISNNSFFSNNFSGMKIMYSHNNTIANTKSHSNEYYGIYIYFSNDNEFSNDHFFNNRRDGFHFHSTNHNNSLTNCIITGNERGIFMDGPVVPGEFQLSMGNEIHYNDIYNNKFYGIDATEVNGSTLNAKNNWWGDLSGPYHSEENNAGRGDNVSRNVDFKPWFKRPINIVREKNEDEQIGPGPILIASCIVLVGIGGIVTLRQDVRYALMSCLMVPLYTKLEKDDVLDQATRMQVFKIITKHPGINFTMILKSLQIGTSSAVHHLSILERSGYIKSRKYMGKRIFLQRDVLINREDLWNLYPETPIRLEILAYFRENGPGTMRDLESELSTSQSTISKNIHELMKEGKVIRLGRKRNAMYMICSDFLRGKNNCVQQ